MSARHDLALFGKERASSSVDWLSIWACPICAPELQVTCIFAQDPVEAVSCASRVSREGRRGVDFV